jgi:hypothetical protein
MTETGLLILLSMLAELASLAALIFGYLLWGELIAWFCLKNLFMREFFCSFVLLLLLLLALSFVFLLGFFFPLLLFELENRLLSSSVTLTLLSFVIRF